MARGRFEILRSFWRATCLGAVAGLLLGGVAHAGVQASGALSILPSDSTLVIGQQITLTVRFTNLSTNTEPPNTDPVAANLTGTTLVKLACTSSTCAVEAPGTLAFISCMALDAGVSTCALDAGDPTNNTVAIVMTAGGVDIAAASFKNLAAITVEATTPILSPVNGQFNTRADTGPDDLEACEVPATEPETCATGGGQGSAVLMFPAVCGDGIVNRAQETCDTNPPGGEPGPDQCCPAGNTNCGTPPNPTGGCPAAAANDNTCRPLGPNECTICGDGVVQMTAGETCDDGNASNTDACTNNCETTTTSTSTSTSSSSSTSTSTSTSSSSSSSSSSSTSTSSTTSTTVPLIGCRVTGGRITPDGGVDDEGYMTISKGTGGGQVGAPCGCIGCFDTFDHIQGQWQYSRKSAKGNLGTFHASDFNSLICGCDDGMGGPGSIVAGLCNPDDREPGPEPRRAPANIMCFSGIGQLSPPQLGKRTVPVAFRVNVHDRGEPGGGNNAGTFSDFYRIEIWIPTGAETPESLADQACCDCPDTGLRQPNIDDGGDLIHGNLQIHPQTPNSQDGNCPVPRGLCSEDVNVCLNE